MIKGLTRMGLETVIGDLDHFVQTASEYGFEAVDISGEEAQSFIAKHGLDGARQFLHTYNVKIGSMALSVQWRTTEEEFRSGLARLAQEAEAAASLGCQICCTYVLPSTNFNAAQFMAVATRRLRTCARLLGAHGIKLALEPVGPHHMRTDAKHPFIWDIGSTMDWIDAIGELNVGIQLDAIHWHTAENTVEDILSLNAEQVLHIHLNDARNVPVAEVLDNDRLFAGEGAINLTGFLGALKQIGYKGIIAQELITLQPPKESLEVLMQRSRDSFAEIFAKAGV